MYTPAHTDSSSTPSTVNALADQLASGSQYLQVRPPPAPLPTFFMGSFMLYSQNDGYIETSITSYLPSVLTSALYSSPDFRPAMTMLLPLYDQHTPPEHPYLRASSAYSALVQLYARSDQLDTTYTRFRRFGNISPLCISGCDSLETVHHIFVSCPTYRSFRQQATKTLITETSRILDSAEVPLLICRSFLHVIRRLFEDGPDWPQSLSRFYLGLMPPLPKHTGLPEAKENRLLARIAHTWHTSCIRLAGRIWAEYKRRVRPAPPKKINNAAAIDLPSFLSPILSS
ncbi:hypothetical protein IW262DRAFT_1351615 [Armillaria fumosa]|nr:hypothetical protein IW262DRAFT_1351615 [Armillaria fumosa]